MASNGRDPAVPAYVKQNTRSYVLAVQTLKEMLFECSKSTLWHAMKGMATP